MSGVGVKEYIIRFRAWLVLLGLMGLAGVSSGGVFLHLSNLSDLVFRGAPLGVAAIGETLVIITGGIDLSVAAVWTLSAVVGASVANHGGSVFVSLSAGLLVGAGVGFINGAITALLSLPPLITTLGMFTICEGAARIYVGNQPILDMPPDYAALGRAYFEGVVPLPIVVLVAVALCVFFLTSRTTFGRELYAVGTNRDAARFIGLRVRFVTMSTYLVAGTLAGLGGVLHSAYLSSVLPNASLTTLFTIIASAVVGGAKLIGGEGNPLDTVAGVLVILAIINVMNILSISPFVEQGALGLVTLLAVYLNMTLNGDSSDVLSRSKGV